MDPIAHTSRATCWKLRTQVLDFQALPSLMGIINVFLLVAGFFLPPVAVILMTAPILLPAYLVARWWPGAPWQRQALTAVVMVVAFLVLMLVLVLVLWVIMVAAFLLLYLLMGGFERLCDLEKDRARFREAGELVEGCRGRVTPGGQEAVVVVLLGVQQHDEQLDVGDRRKVLSRVCPSTGERRTGKRRSGTAACDTTPVRTGL